jgi:glycopeptide antibiotics resistance protein
MAFATGFVLVFLLFVPYIGWTYRRRGELGLGHALLSVGFLVYVMSLWTYTLLPAPSEPATWCLANAVRAPQLQPLAFTANLDLDQLGPSLRASLRDPLMQSALFNVALFVPFGMLVRHLFRRGIVATTVLGLAVSLLIEYTQRTAVWGLFDCPYRLFDVDDLLTNTTGALLGALIAPVLHVVPWQTVTRPAKEPRPVRAGRRLLGMLVDVFSVLVLGAVINTFVNVVRWRVLDQDVPRWTYGYLIVAVVLLLVVPLVGNGATSGQRLVELRGAGPDESKAAWWRLLLRFCFGLGGFLVWPSLGVPGLVVPFFLLVTFVTVFWPRDHRGLSGLVSGVRPLDSRHASRPVPPTEEPLTRV